MRGTVIKQEHNIKQEEVKLNKHKEEEKKKKKKKRKTTTTRRMSTRRRRRRRKRRQSRVRLPQTPASMCVCV